MGIPVNFRTRRGPAEANARTSNGEIKIGVIRPGEIVKVKVTNRAMSIFGNELLKRGIEDLEQVTIDFRFVYFDDHTRWVMGQNGLDPDAGNRSVANCSHPTRTRPMRFPNSGAERVRVFQFWR